MMEIPRRRLDQEIELAGDAPTSWMTRGAREKTKAVKHPARAAGSPLGEITLVELADALDVPLRIGASTHPRC
jgi:hypothetical protein